MNQLEWAQIEQIHQDEFGGPMRGSRWRQKFGGLPFGVVRKAMLMHGENSNAKPTMMNLIECLPKGMVHSSRVDHVHAWDEQPMAYGQEGNLVWCDTCGRHDRSRCACERCLCDHENRIRVSARWDECPDCEGVIRVRE